MMRGTFQACAVSMAFPGVRALDRVDFDVRAGEIHALVGENGAGKSTLIKILSGEIDGYEGEVRIDGQIVRFASPRDAIAAGVAVIPQELQLVSALPADANLYLGREPQSRWGFVDRARLAADAARQMSALGEDRVPRGPVGGLEGGVRQLVAIARALSLDARLLIMDEPTTSLGPFEVARLERVIVDLAARGVAIVYISHRLDEVTRLAHRITVLRDGQLVATVAASDVDEQEIVRLMVGRTIERRTLAPLAEDAEPLLAVEHLSVPDADRPGGYRLRDVSLTVRRGEIVGLAGLVGAGRSDLLLALVGGLDRRVEGHVRLSLVHRAEALCHDEFQVKTGCGAGLQPCETSIAKDPAAARAAGLVLLPEDRKIQAIFPDLSVQSNIALGGLEQLTRAGVIARAREKAACDRLARETGVRAAAAEVPIATLSGGNQQKAVLARCLFASPSVLLLDEPTRGIDLAAKADIYDLINGLARRGYGIVLCSSELPEILTLCHRVHVFREGTVAATFTHDQATEERIMAAATGTSEVRSPESDVRSQATAGSDSGERRDESPNPSSVGTLTSEDGDRGRKGGSATGSPPAGSRAGRNGSGRRAWLTRFSSLIGLAAVIVLAIVFSPVRGGRLVFLDLGNLTDILRQVAEKGILAAGMTPVIISGGIDLSVGSVLALAATLTGLLLMKGSVGIVLTALIVLGVGAAIGLVNGAVTARWRIQPFIVTLATMSAARGVARYISGGAAIPLGFGDRGAPESFRLLAAPIVPYVPVPAVLFLGSVVAIYVLLARLAAGRYVYAIGDNEQAARLSGIRVARYKMLVYGLCGMLAALAGLIHCAQLEQGNPNDGIAYELDAIAAVVIGGTSLSGGIGTVGGTLVGTLIIGIINNSMGLNNVDANLQLILKGAIILGAVWLQTRRK